MYAIVDAAVLWTDHKGSGGLRGGSSLAKGPHGDLSPRSVHRLKDTFVVAGADNFNRRDEVSKTFEVRKLEQISGIWTALELVMLDRRDRTRTELSVTKAEYNVGLTETDFNRRTLEQDAR